MPAGMAPDSKESLMCLGHESRNKEQSIANKAKKSNDFVGNRTRASGLKIQRSATEQFLEIGYKPIRYA